jgi:hypothetical protein
MSRPRTVLRCVAVGDWMVASHAEVRWGRLTAERVASTGRGWEGKSGTRKVSISSRLPRGYLLRPGGGDGQ